MWILLALSLGILAYSVRLAAIIVTAALIVAWWQGVLLWQGVLALGITAIVAVINRQFQQVKWVKLSSELILATIALTLMLHHIPGFNNLRVIQPEQLGEHSYPPFTFYFNLDKALLPFVLIGCLTTLFLQKTTQHQPWWKWCALAFSLPLLLIIGVIIGGLGFEYHFPAWIDSFILANLFFVSLAEEALFRGWLQRRLSQQLGNSLGLMISVVLFGLYHIAGGTMLVIFSSLAAIIYGLAWQWSRSLWIATSFHFTLNIIHLLFFTYPMLKH